MGRMNKVFQLQEIIDNSKNIVVLSGAGVSTDSGLKDFRSKNGIYNLKNQQQDNLLNQH